jgi:hypothetical protein
MSRHAPHVPSIGQQEQAQECDRERRRWLVAEICVALHDCPTAWLDALKGEVMVQSGQNVGRSENVSKE